MRYLLAICLLLGTTFAAQNAGACSGSQDASISLQKVLPAGNEVPINANIFLLYTKYGYLGREELLLKKAMSIQLRKKSGVILPTTLTTQTWGYHIFVKVTPSQPLDPGTTYSITSQVSKTKGCSTSPNTCPDDTFHEVGKFTTGTTQDTTPPSFRGVSSLKQYYYESENSCTTREGIGRATVRIHWEATKRNETGNNYFYYIYEANNRTKPVFGFVPSFLQDGKEFTSLGVDFLCFGQQQFYRAHPFAGIARGNKDYIIRAVDVAGNKDNNTSTFVWRPDCRRSSEREPTPQEPQKNEPAPDASPGRTQAKPGNIKVQGCTMLVSQPALLFPAWLLFFACVLMTRFAK